MAREGVRYRISSDFDNKGVKAAEKGLLAFGKSALKATVGITSASIAVQKLTRFLQQSVQAALADEKAYRTLGQTLQTAGFGAAADQVKDFIDAQQLATGVAEDQLIPAYTTLFNTLQSVSAAQETLRIAQDVALATGKDLNQVTTAFARAAAGNTTALSRLGIGITKAELASSDFITILTKLEAKFGGTTGAVLDTTAVRMDRLRVAVGEAKEEIGKGLVDAFNMAANASTTSVDTMQGNIIRLGTSIGDVFRGLGGVASKFKTEMPDALSDAINQGFKQSFGVGGEVVSLLQVYGESLRLETEKSIRQGMANVYTGGPRADRMSAGTMGLVIVQRQIYLAEQARKKELARQKALEQARLARERAAEAQKKKQAAMDKAIAEKAITYDTERVALQAALSKTTDAATRKRLTDLLAINAATYAEDLQLTSIKDILTLINEEMKKYTQATDDTGKGIGAWVTSLTNVETALKSATVAASGLTSEFGSAARAASTIPVAGAGAVIRGPQAPTIPDAYIPPVAATAAAAAVDAIKQTLPAVTAAVKQELPVGNVAAAVEAINQFVPAVTAAVKQELPVGNVAAAVEAIKQTLPAVTAAVMQELPVGNVSPEFLPAAGPSFIDRQVSSQIAEALPVVNVVVQGSVIAETDLATAVGQAVNRYTRSGGRLNPVAI